MSEEPQEQEVELGPGLTWAEEQLAKRKAHQAATVLAQTWAMNNLPIPQGLEVESVLASWVLTLKSLENFHAKHIKSGYADQLIIVAWGETQLGTTYVRHVRSYRAFAQSVAGYFGPGRSYREVTQPRRSHPWRIELPGKEEPRRRVLRSGRRLSRETASEPVVWTYRRFADPVKKTDHREAAVVIVELAGKQSELKKLRRSWFEEAFAQEEERLRTDQGRTRKMERKAASRARREARASTRPRRGRR